MTPIRIANCSGFFGDRLAAASEMVDGGPIDVLTGDYLAELTMAILARQRMRDPQTGYVRTFLTQMEQVLGRCMERGIKVVANAGGLNPRGLADALAKLASELGLAVSVGVVTGDDLTAEPEGVVGDLVHRVTGEVPADRGLELLTANAYLGGWGIAAALERGADVVVTGRVSDAALVVGPAAHHHRWRSDDWDALAGAVVAGHVIECGAQATGGNFSFFDEVPGLAHPGFPIAEVAADGSSVITKHEGTGGLVSVETVISQLLYEIGGPRYLNPDVTARFDTISVRADGPDRVSITGARGEPPPATAKVAATALGGFRNSVTFLLTGLGVEAKAAAAEEALWKSLGGRDRFADSEVSLLRTDQPDPPSNEAAMAYLQVTVTDPDPSAVGRAFSGAAVELALASYPGFALTAPPGKERPLVVYWPSTVPQRPSIVTVAGDTFAVDPPAAYSSADESAGIAAAHDLGDDVAADGPTRRVPMGSVVGARSGDKGGDANVGVFTRTDDAFTWLDRYLSVARFRDLIPEARDLTVDRYAYPNLRALNFVVRGLLGEGVSSSTRWDPQAKGLGEYLRARLADIPVRLLDE
jgi:hypothetical protein